MIIIPCLLHVLPIPCLIQGVHPIRFPAFRRCLTFEPAATLPAGVPEE